MGVAKLDETGALRVLGDARFEADGAHFVEGPA
jgi:hypothetical protein